MHTLFLAGYLTDELTTSDTNQQMLVEALNGAGQVAGVAAGPTGVNYHNELKIFSGEVQQIFQTENHNTIFGLRGQSGTLDTQSKTAPFAIGFFPIPGSSQSVSSDFDRISLYAYHYWQVADPIQLVAGLTYDHLHFPLNYRVSPISTSEDTVDKISPKVGLTWTPIKGTVVRGAYTRSLGGVSFDESVRLEPSQIAGFSQAYRSIMPESVGGSTAAPQFETFALGLEQTFKSRT